MWMICFECKSWEPHACMYVMCIGILPRYVMLVWTRTFNIYVHHYIMRASPFLWCPATCNKLCSTKSGPSSTYTSSPGGYICTCVGRMWESTTHQILSGTWRVQNHVTVLKDKSQSCDVCDCITNTNSVVTYQVFLKILKSRVTFLCFRLR